MPRPDGLIELPNGEAIFYDDSNHAYYRAVPEKVLDSNIETWRRSTRLTGASTLSKPFSYDSGRLLAWKERMTCEGIAWLLSDEQILGDPVPSWTASGDSIRAKLKEESLLADDARDRKATIGTNVHSVLEGLAGVCPMPNVDEMEEAEKPYARAIFKWWELRRPEVHEAEAFVYNAELGYAGRFDLRAVLHECEDSPGIDPFFHDKLTLADLKSSGYIAASHHAQLALYNAGAIACGIGGSDGQMILQVKPDGSFREIKGQATHDDALACVAVYRAAGRIEREAKAA